MALSIDSRAVLRAIADHPEAFPAIQGDLDEFARKMMGKQIKHKATGLAEAKALTGASGDKAFATVIDGFSSAELTALLKKLDANNPLVKGGDVQSTRAAIDDLVAGRAQPSEKTQKPAKATAPKKTPAPRAAKPKIGDLLESKVHAGTPRKKAPAKKTA